MVIRAGKMRHRVIIQSASETLDTYGASAQTWSEDATVWAAVVATGSAESRAHQQVAPGTTHAITLRHRKLNAENRLLLPKAITALAAGIDNAVTSLTVDEALGVSASTPFRIEIGDELMEVTAGQGTTSWTVTRGVDGTSAAAHLTDAAVTQMAILEIAGIVNVDELDEQLDISAVERP